MVDISKNQRKVFLLKFQAHPYGATNKRTPINKIIDHIENSYKNNTSKIPLDKNGNMTKRGEDKKNLDYKNAIYIANMQIDREKSIATLLINRGNPNSATSTFLNTNENKTRRALISDDETIGYSAHLIIKFDKKSGTQGFYSCALEKMPHLPRTLIRRFLTRLLHEEFSRNNMEEDRPIIKIEGQLSDSLKADLKKGRLTMVSISKSKTKMKGIDIEDEAETITKTIQIKIKKDLQSKAFGLLNKLTRKAYNANYDEMQVNITGLDDNKPVKQRYRIEESQIAESLYIKQEQITDFNTPLETCYNEINDEIKSKILKIM